MPVSHPYPRLFSRAGTGSAGSPTPPPGSSACRDGRSPCRAGCTAACRFPPERRPIPAATSRPGSQLPQLRGLFLRGRPGLLLRALLRCHLIRRGDRDLRCPFRLQKLRHLRKAKAVAVMGGVLPVLMQHHNIRYRQGVPGEVRRAVHIEPGINAFKVVLRRQRGGVNLLIVLRLYGKTVVTDGIQRLKAIACII